MKTNCTTGHQRARFWDSILEDKGQQEFSNGSNPWIVKLILWAMPWVSKDVDDGDVAWCAIYAAHVFKKNNLQPLLPKNFFRVSSYKNMPLKEVGILEAKQGDLVLMWRKSPTSGLGHLTFFDQRLDTKFLGLGGNQNNGVNVVDFPYARVVKVYDITSATLMKTKTRHSLLDKIIMKVI